MMRRALLRHSLLPHRLLSTHATMDGATHEYGNVLKALAHYYKYNGDVPNTGHGRAQVLNLESSEHRYGHR